MKLLPIKHELNTPCADCDYRAASFILLAEATQKSFSLCCECAMELFWLLADNREKE
jgi:hypothetical protein